MFTQTDETATWQCIRQTRIELIDYLETLSDEQWNHDSLCEGWKAKDVLAHLILEYHYRAANSGKDFVTSGFRINTFMKQTAITHGRQPPVELLEQFRAMIAEQHKPASVSVLNVLVDLLVHEQDIRIPLNQPKDMDMESLRLIFAHWEPGQYNFGEKITGLSSRLKGLKFIVTDLNITKGEGKEVKGKAQDILLAVVGRKVTINQLHGEGLVILRNRLK